MFIKINIEEICDILGLSIDVISMLHSYDINTDRDLFDIYKYGMLSSENSNHQKLDLKEIFSNFPSNYYSTIVEYLTKPSKNVRPVNENAFSKFNLHSENNISIKNDVRFHIELHDIQGLHAHFLPYLQYKQLMHTKKKFNLDMNTNFTSNLISDDTDIAFMQNVNKRRSKRTDPLRLKCNHLLKQLRMHSDCGPFLEPVSLEIDGYYDKIAHAMDLATIQHKLNENLYLTFAHFCSDFALIIANCKLFNMNQSEIVSMCVRLDNCFQNETLKYDEEIKLKLQKN